MDDSSQQLVEMNQELIEYMQTLIGYNAYYYAQTQTQTQQEPVIKKYKERVNVKATEYERQKSREYYIANRELILQKRRIHNAKLKNRRICKT